MDELLRGGLHKTTSPASSLFSTSSTTFLLARKLKAHMLWTVGYQHEVLPTNNPCITPAPTPNLYSGLYLLYKMGTPCIDPAYIRWGTLDRGICPSWPWDLALGDLDCGILFGEFFPRGSCPRDSWPDDLNRGICPMVPWAGDLALGTLDWGSCPKINCPKYSRVYISTILAQSFHVSCKLNLPFSRIHGFLWSASTKVWLEG